jgi:hypothetical protein
MTSYVGKSQLILDNQTHPYMKLRVKFNSMQIIKKQWLNHLFFQMGLYPLGLDMIAIVYFRIKNLKAIIIGTI